MKCFSIFFLIIVAFSAANAQTHAKCCQFKITGAVDSSNKDTIDLQYTDAAGKNIKDSLITTKPNFVISGMIKQPTTIAFAIRGKDRSYKKSAVFYIEPADMKMIINKDDLNLSVLTGSKIQREYDQLVQKETKISGLILSGSGSYAAETEDARRLIRKDSIRKLEFDFISGHPDSYLSPYLMKKYAGFLYRDTLKVQYQRLSAQIKNNPVSKEIYAYLQLPEIRPGQLKIGDDAPAFEEKDIDHKLLKLSSYKGKNVILLDFWASWCGPCLAMLPKIKRLYAEYHPSGLEVIGVNMDYTPEKWQQSVKREGMNNWKNIFPGKIRLSNEYPIIASYGIKTIPALFLIDKEGKILKIINDEDSVDQELTPVLKKIFTR